VVTQETRPPAGRWARLRATVRVTSPRFTAYYALALLAGTGASTPFGAWLVPFALVYCVAWCLAVEATNRLSDRAEDAVNQPARTAACEEAGWGTLRRVAVGGWALVVQLDMVWCAVTGSVAVAALLGLGLLVGLGYSVGPRWKARPWPALLALCAPTLLPLLTGLLTRSSTDGARGPVLATAGLVVLAALTTAGAKDVTDVVGDRLTGYSSVWLRLLARGTVLSTALVTQVVAVAALTISGVVPVTGWLALGWVALQKPALRAVVRAVTPDERRIAREGVHTTTVLGLALTVAAFQPTAFVVTAAAAAVAWWLLVSRFGHWNRVLSRASLPTWWRLATPPTLPTDPERTSS